MVLPLLLPSLTGREQWRSATPGVDCRAAGTRAGRGCRLAQVVLRAAVTARAVWNLYELRLCAEVQRQVMELRLAASWAYTYFLNISTRLLRFR